MSQENVELVTAAQEAIFDALNQQLLPTTPILGGATGVTAPVSAVVRTVERRLGEPEDLEAAVDRAVKRLGGQRVNYADTAGFLWKLRRSFGQSSERPEDVYLLPGPKQDAHADS